MTNIELRGAFREHHRRGSPLILPNIWDAGSAKAVADAGAKALATSSWAVAAAHGFNDGEEVPLPLVIANLGRIDRVSSLPVTVDFEGGYGDTMDELDASFGQLLTTCAVGCNLEDGVPAGGIRLVEDQAGRIEAVRQVGDPAPRAFFINPRPDLFLRESSERHADEELVNQAIERARVYQQAGADGYFVPGLTELSVLRTLAQAVELPINVMAGDEAIDCYIQAGVARISFGPLTYLKTVDAVGGFAAARF